MQYGTEYKDAADSRTVESAQKRRPSIVLNYKGLKYVLRKRGPFSGRFMTGSELVTIDGEDYIKFDILCPVLNTPC